MQYFEEHNLMVRPVVHKGVNKMMKCKTKALGYSLFQCPNCRKEKYSLR